MPQISWQNKVTNVSVLEKADEERRLLNTTKKNRLLGHVLRNDVLLRDIADGKMKGKEHRGRKRLQMLSGLGSSAK